MSRAEKHKSAPRPTTIVLVRHATNDWVKRGRLAGRTPGVHLNQDGQAQAEALASRLVTWPIRAIYASPLERARETAAPMATLLGLEVVIEAAIAEVDVGEWAGRKLKELAKKGAWHVVQTRPSAMRFPAGESLRGMQNRAVDAVEQLAARHPEQCIVVVSHADVIKAIVAHYLGLHLDQFQRVIISPASISVLAFSPAGGLVVSLNDTAHLPQQQEEDE